MAREMPGHDTCDFRAGEHWTSSPVILWAQAAGDMQAELRVYVLVVQPVVGDLRLISSARPLELAEGDKPRAQSDEAALEGCEAVVIHLPV